MPRIIPPIPFPLPMAVGTDICDVHRIKRLLTGKNPAKFVKRILRPDEIPSSPVWGILQTTPSDVPTDLVEFQRACSFMAGRFAAKEAVVKAHNWWRLSFHDIRISRRPDGSPYATVWPRSFRKGDGEDAEERGKRDQVTKHTRRPQEALVSISHEEGYATAVCLGWDHGPQVGNGERRGASGEEEDVIMEDDDEKVVEREEEEEWSETERGLDSSREREDEFRR